MTWHKPNGEESFARHGEQEELARRVDADGKLINRALDHFSKDAFCSDRNRCLEPEREREIGLGLHRVRVIEVLILPFW